MMKSLINTGLLVLSLTLSGSCLWVVSHAPWYWAITGIWFFALINNMPFAIMHEAVHGVAAESRWANRLIGVIAGWAFPMSFLLQRKAHLDHHNHNRTDRELYDYFLPNQLRWLRNSWLYLGNLFGFYYFCVVLGNAIWLVAWWFYRSTFFVKRVAPVLGFGSQVAELAALPVFAVWCELALAFTWQAILFWLLDLNILAYTACLWGFALHWSALQYVNHAWSRRDVKNGAWNLKVLPLSRWLALNYHFHLAHHQHPAAPWYELPSLVDDQPRPTFWRIWFSLWRNGVRPAPPMGAPANFDLLNSCELHARKVL
ncbi:fatty acid desaturase family protein [Dryocola sp. BD626]|uniref:fatty acid desaturase family protein n=1 Tax=Dryocola sp. BD626 TaxID=3133273 RepID=UPI003F503F1A